MAAYSTFVFPTLGGDEQEPSKKFKLCFFPSWVANTKHNPWTNTVEMRESGLEFTQSSSGKNLDNLYNSLVRLLSRKLSPTQLVCVDFTATWCGPCQKIGPKFVEMASIFDDCEFVKVDVDEKREDHNRLQPHKHAHLPVLHGRAKGG